MPDWSLALQHMAQHISQAAQDRDWEALRRLDAQASSLLSHRRTTPWRHHERQALQDLIVAHREAMVCCLQASQELTDAMRQMHEHKDGWMAYAMHSE